MKQIKAWMCERCGFITLNKTVADQHDELCKTVATIKPVDVRDLVNQPNKPFSVKTKKVNGSRNILGKLLAYLQANESARGQLKQKAASKGSQASPELMKALSSLLKDSDEKACHEEWEAIKASRQRSE